MKPPDAAPSPAELLAALPTAVLLIGEDGGVVHANACAEELLNRSNRLMAGQTLATLLARREPGRIEVREAELAELPGWRVAALLPQAGPGIDRAGRGGRAAVGAAAMLAHEIRNPLSGIRGAAQLLGACELTRLITDEVDRIAALIDRMQEFGDTRPLPLGAQNIYPLLAHARTLAAAGFAAGIAIEERYDPSLPPAAANRDALIQVLVNLLRNAAEAVAQRPGATITLTTAYRHGVRAGPAGSPLPIEICVVDDGPGVPLDIADQVFEPFVSGKPEGQGLGLALVDKLIRDMGGVVQHAREGNRTVFRLLLRRAET